MMIIPRTNYKKATQALNFFARKKDNKINKMKAIKLIYLADRLHLRKYGRPIVGDKYFAMKYGPVGSQTKNIAELSCVSEEVVSYAKKYIKPITICKENDSLVSIKKDDLSVFSDTDVECLEIIYKNFSDKDQFELAELTHKYPEWLKHKKDLEKKYKKRVKMDYNDFFDSGLKEENLFKQSRSNLSLSKESFKESEAVFNFFSN